MVRPKGQTIRFPDDILAKLESLSEETDLSINKTVIRICREYFDEKEAVSSGDVEGADLRHEVLDFFRSDEGRELVKEFVEKMKDND